MIGPLFHQELLLGGRRNRLHVFRWLYAGWLVCQVFYLYLHLLVLESARVQTLARSAGAVAYQPVSAPQVVGGWFVETFLFQQMILLVLTVPALVAGAVAEEKQRGTLLYLLTTDLDMRHIILGKMLGRLAQVLWLLLTGLPLAALLAGFGGVGPLQALFLVAVFVPPAFGLAGMALLASVWCRQTRDAVLGLYLVCVAGWLAFRLAGGVPGPLDPLQVSAPIWAAGDAEAWREAGRRFLASCLGWGGLGCACLLVAVWRLRPAYVRELERGDGRGRHAYGRQRDPVPDDPVLWREREVEGLAPAASLRRVPFWLATVLVAGVTTASSLAILVSSLPPGVEARDLLRAGAHLNLARLTALLPRAEVGFLLQGIVVLLLASLVVGIRCSGAITGERERDTWESLLLTPITARQVVRSKLWGVMGASYWYLLAYAAPAISLSVLGGLLAFFWTALWLGVTLLAMYYVGAAGLWCSARSRSSWRSLLGTLGFGYLGGVVLFVVSSPVIAILAGILLLMLAVTDSVLGTQLAGFAAQGLSTYWTLFFVAACIGLALAFWLMSRLFLGWAGRWIADRERTRHWEDMPLERRSRSRRGPRPMARSRHEG